MKGEMNVQFKFQLNNEVSITGQNRKGSVKIRKLEESYKNGELQIIVRYYVDCGLYYQNWYDEQQLEYADDKDIKVSPETDKFLLEHALRGAIDHNLKLRKFDVVAELTKQLNELNEKKVSE